MQIIACLLMDGFEISGLAPLSVFEAANAMLGERRYSVALLSEAGGAVRGAFGIDVVTGALGIPACDTVLVAGGATITETSPLITSYLRRAARSVRRIAAVRLGAFALAEAGLLDGRRATVQRDAAECLKQRFPAIHVEDDHIYVEDRAIWTSAGMTAGVDLAIGLLEQDLGADAAVEVARRLLLQQRRDGRSSQRSQLLDIAPKSDRVQRALAYAQANLKSRLTVEELAGVAALSPRQFSRLFQQETGHSPAQAVERLRIDAARILLGRGRMPISSIVAETGFGDRERMRRAFRRRLDVSPRALRDMERQRSIA